MIVIGLSDIHGETGVIQRMGSVLARADVVLLAGDITHFGHAGHAARVLETIRQYAGCVLAVPGNCDYPDVDQWLDQEGINLHARARVIGEIGFAGLGGSIFTPFRTPNEYSEAEARRFLSAAVSALPVGLPFVLLSHQPPAGTACDRIRSGRHVGSRALREFIEKHRPLACFSGHIHESAGTDRIGETWIVNPGQPGRGGYARADISDKSFFVKIQKIII